MAQPRAPLVRGTLVLAPRWDTIRPDPEMEPVPDSSWWSGLGETAGSGQDSTSPSSPRYTSSYWGH
jgi:hypothetical protein